jgi:uncharacterized protein
MMTIYAIRCVDGAGAAALRQQHLVAHLAHIEANIERYRIAGPLKGADGADIGSLLVIEATDAAAARAFVISDPYGAAGVWADVTVDVFLAAAGTWVGGAAWKQAR